MDGSALYMIVSVIFIAQTGKHVLGGLDLFIAFVTVIAVSIGTAGIPNSSIFSIALVLDTLGLPHEDVSIILATDWLLDRSSTVINVLSDAIGAKIIYHICRKELASRPCNIM